MHRFTLFLQVSIIRRTHMYKYITAENIHQIQDQRIKIIRLAMMTQDRFDTRQVIFIVVLI